MPPANCVLTLLTLEGACPSIDAYRVAMRGLVSLLKPGRHLATMAALHVKHYLVGLQFFGIYLKKKMVEAALQEAGCQMLGVTTTPLAALKLAALMRASAL